MEADYPAAHSQDTDWFAVDAAGHVAFFESGEEGHVPEGIEDSGAIHELWQLRHPGQPTVAYWRDRAHLAIEVGVYCYHYDGESRIHIAPYRLTGAPYPALHVDQLPPSLRQHCKQVLFQALDFSQAELIQPLEWFPCVCWYQESCVAYLAGDGMTVRPIPGKEDRFAEFCKQFRKAYPKEAMKLIFEGLEISKKGKGEG